VGHGRAYRYRSPGGHLHEVFWEVERFRRAPKIPQGLVTLDPDGLVKEMEGCANRAIALGYAASA
jgi:hypothetical protein